MLRHPNQENKRPPYEWFVVDESNEGQYSQEFNKLGEGKVAGWMKTYQQGNENLLLDQTSADILADQSFDKEMQRIWGHGYNFESHTPDTSAIIKAEQDVISATTFTPARLEVERIRKGEGDPSQSIFFEDIHVDNTGEPIATKLRAVIRGYTNGRGESNPLLMEMSDSVYLVDAIVAIETKNQSGGTFNAEIYKGNRLLDNQSGYFGSTLNFAGRQPIIDKRLGMTGSSVTSFLAEVRSLSTRLEIPLLNE